MLQLPVFLQTEIFKIVQQLYNLASFFDFPLQDGVSVPEIYRKYGMMHVFGVYKDGFRLFWFMAYQPF